MRRSLAVIVLAVLTGGAVAFAASMDVTSDDLTTATQSTVVDTIPTMTSSTSSTTTSSTSSTTSTTLPSGTTLYLKTSTQPPANVTSSSVLPLSTSAPTQATLFNYDTDRDGAAGRLIEEGPNGEGPNRTQTDLTKRQRWAVSGPMTLNGTATLTFSAQMLDGNNNQRGHVRGHLMRCATGTTAAASCTQLANGNVDTNPWSATNNQFASKTISFGSLSNVTVTSSQVLVLQLTVDGQSGNKMWFAYDTTNFLSRLVIQ